MATVRPATLSEVASLIDMAEADFSAAFPVAGDAGRVEAMLGGLVFSQHGYLNVIERDAGVIGFLAGIVAPFEPWSSVLCATELLLFAKPEHRGRVASHLLKDFEDWARSKGCDGVIVAAQSGMEGNRLAQLYERKGFHSLETRYFRRLG